MQNFANQCLDMARSILEHNLGAIDENGIILPVEGEIALPEESAHALAAIGEFYRATRETKIFWRACRMALLRAARSFGRTE